MHALSIFILLLVPVILTILLLSPRDTWWELKSVYDPRLIRRSLRLGSGWKRIRRPQFTLRSLICIAGLVALQIAIPKWLGLQGTEYWAMFIILLMTSSTFFGVAYATSWRPPRRKHRETHQRVISYEPLPVIETEQTTP